MSGGGDVSRRELVGWLASLPFAGAILPAIAAAERAAGVPGFVPRFFTAHEWRTVRLLVDVPQTYAQGIKNGQSVDVIVQERPSRVFKGIVSRTAGALDPASRTLLVEVRIPNTDGALAAGLYAEAHFHADRVVAPLVVAANALVTRSDGIQVVEVRPAGAHYQHVALGRDYGATVELTDGATEGDTVVVNPSDDVIEGAKLHVLPPPPAPEH